MLRAQATMQQVSTVTTYVVPRQPEISKVYLHLSIIHSTIVFYTKQLRMQSDSGQVLQEVSLESTVQYSRGTTSIDRAVGTEGTKGAIAPNTPIFGHNKCKIFCPLIYFDLPPCLHVGQGGEIYALSSQTGIVSSGQNLTSLELTRTFGKDPRWVLIYLITFCSRKAFNSLLFEYCIKESTSF